MKSRNTVFVGIKVLIAIVVAVILGVVVFLSVQSIRENDKIETSIKEGKSALDTLATTKVSEIEKQIEEIEKEQAKPIKKEPTSSATSESIENENPETSELKAKFKNSCIVGDSLVEGLVESELLGSDVVVSQIGVTSKTTDNLINKVINLNPKTVFLAFGINDLLLFENNISMFKDVYKKNVEKLQKGLPSATIYVNAIIPFTPSAIAKKPLFKNRTAYNNALSSLCTETGAIYIDGSFIIEGKSNMYSQDGIHPLTPYYKKWLSFMAQKAGL
ncbi:MAG: GDSL-type esterase/lipase family protein [Clostridia bacterium]